MLQKLLTFADFSPQSLIYLFVQHYGVFMFQTTNKSEITTVRLIQILT